MKKILSHISQEIGENISSSHPVSGGDISSAYLLETKTGKFFLKVNAKPFALAMFQAEQKGLQAIEETQTISVPHVLCVGFVEEKSFLLMDYVESKRPDSSDFQRLGMKLAKLHEYTQTCFGFPTDNFIGSLPQSNTPNTNWPDFYWDERIFPQLQRARENRLLSQSEIPTKEKAIAVFNEIFKNVKPSLVHGDLWGGNYLIGVNGTPYLIDPATYFGHSMADIAMSKLFGGFGASFYGAYHQVIPQTENYFRQVELHQLYFLLVHLNLFGSAYHSSVLSILKRYFG